MKTSEAYKVLRDYVAAQMEGASAQIYLCVRVDSIESRDYIDWGHAQILRRDINQWLDGNTTLYVSIADRATAAGREFDEEAFLSYDPATYIRRAQFLNFLRLQWIDHQIARYEAIND